MLVQPAGSASAAVTGVQFNTDVTVAGREETVWVTANSAGTVSLSIDFDQDGTLEPSEQVVTNQAVTSGVNRIVYTVPTGDAFVPGAGALTRITSAPDGGIVNTTRELYDAEAAALVQCPAGTVPIAVSVIQNPSFESRLQDFQNDSADNTINYAANWFDRHTTGGQYHYFDPPTFDSGPVESTQPVRAGADGQAFLGGHSSGGTAGEGATNTLLVPLNPASTYVGFFSMAAGGYSREGNGYMQFFGTNDINMGHIPQAGVTNPTAANTELLYSTPVVNYAGNGVRPTWDLNTFTLDPGQAWPYLRVEVRNANPAADVTVAGQVWMNFDDFHMYECTPRLLQITKTSDATADTRPGDTVNYTVTATNVGSVDFTVGEPAVLLDDLTGVLDDATYNGDVSSDLGADPTFANSRLMWTGALAAQQSVTVTYSVTLTGSGDGVVRNAAFQSRCVPGTTGCPPPPTPVSCANNLDPATGLPCAEVVFELPRLQIVKSADRTTLPATGDVVTYTVTVTNLGPGDYTVDSPATMTDDLSGVIDDTSDPSPINATVGSAAFTSPNLSWSGVLASGQAATITYAVTYDALGDQSLENVACVPQEQALDPALACIPVTIPGSGLVQEKVADPRSDTAIEAGDTVTYTLAFTNTGNAPATVNTTDDLTDVLDDASVTSGPTFDAGLTASPSGNLINITGTVPVNQVLYVTYTVTVRPYAAQGNHVLANALACQPGDPQPCEPQVTEHPIRHLALTKQAVPLTDVNLGDVVTYTLTITNDGEGDYTDLDPASITDGLSGVLDDATYNEDATPSAGAVTEALPFLFWNGPLASGQSATVTYTVTVTSAGDHSLENTAVVPSCLDDPSCTPPAVVVPLPHIVPAKTSDPVSGAPVRVGDVVTYTLTFSNDGEAAGPVDTTDDLSDIVDDGDVTSEPVSSDPAITAVRNGGAVRITGSLAADASVTITYQVTVRPDGQRGNNIARNVLNMDVPPVTCAGNVCTPVPPPITEHPIGELDDWKTVEPASGSTVQPGAVVTFTLHFANTGEADVDVNRDDVVSSILDDASINGAPTSSDATLTVSPINGDRFTITGTLTPGQEVTVTYAATVKPDGQRGDDALANFLVDPGAPPPATCVPSDPARPDCTVNYVGSLTVSKSSNPADGSQVNPGGQITYTLTFTNPSANPASGAVPVDHIDYLANVLDDATLTGAPQTSDAALAAVQGDDTIHVTGQLTAGQTVTVTYVVTVKPYEQQGNHTLVNIVARNGDTPVCTPGLCTTQTASQVVPPPPPEPTVPPTSPDPGELPATGGSTAPIARIAMALLLAGAFVLFATRRRRQQRPS